MSEVRPSAGRDASIVSGRVEDQIAKERHSKLALWAAVVFGGIAVALLIVALVKWDTKYRDLALAFGGIMLGLGAWCGFAWLKPGPPECDVDAIDVFADRICITRDGSTTPFSWDQVEQVWRDVYVTYINGEKHGTNHCYRIRLSDQTEIRFTSTTFQNGEAVGEQIHRIVTEHQVPKFREAIDNGRAVDFDILSVRKEGIEFLRRTLSWDQFEGIGIAEGNVIVSANGKLWCSVELKDVPNPDALMALTDCLQKDARAG